MSSANDQHTTKPKSQAWSTKPLKKAHGTVQAFFLSNLGRQCFRGAALAAASGTFMGYVALNTLYIETYRDKVQHYKHGFPQQVSVDLEYKLQEVMNDMKIRERFQKAVRLFYMYGFDPHSIGSLKTKYGIAVGVPKYFDYKTPADIDREQIQIEQKPVPWHSEDGQLFQDSLVLSDNAKKFAIAQQLSMGDTHYVYVNGGIHSGSILLYTILSAKVNQLTYGLYKPLSFRIVCVYFFTGMFTYGVWSASRYIYNKSLESLGDKRAAGLGVDYAKGGVEYYSKLIKRNIAQRALMGPNGEKMFTQLGNYKEFILQKTLLLTDRKINAEKQVELLLSTEISSQKNESNNNNNDASQENLNV